MQGRLGNNRAKKSSASDERKRVRLLLARLAAIYPEVRCFLEHENPFQLLVATILSAQSTDEQVNRVAPRLLRLFPTPEALRDAPVDKLEGLIRSLGLFRAKARALKKMSAELVEKFGSKVPPTMQELTQLTGVGRKTANVILGYAFGTPGIVVDTHVKRLAGRLGLSAHAEPEKIERDLMKIIPRKEWTNFSHRLILHGRRVCHARKPRCEECNLRHLCPWEGKRVS
ncbi:MAG TPA: endonuclease III [Candidatus Acidoferrales bacterium]|nr:endonuclease III [Candidatus Acidoferrales bacterium]